MAELNTTKQNRLYKGKVVFKWEDNPGHHCGICAKPFSKDSCKVTCIGKHAEPCYRFHQILHFLGKAHECSPCITSDQMHYNRLKEVLVLVRKIKELDDADVLRTAPQAKKVGTQETGGMRRRHSIAETTTDADSETLNDIGPKLNKRERKRQRRSDVGSTKSTGQLEVFTKEDIEFIDWAIHLSEPDTKDIDQFDVIADQSIPLGRAECHEDNKENTINDANLSITPLKQKDSNTSLPTPNSILTRSNKFRYFGKGSQKHARKNGDIFDGLDPSILDRLGVEITTPNHSSQRKDLIAKLIEAIKNDIEVIDRENAEAKFREIAFFRWAGKTCKHAMDEAHKNYDWQTGLLKKNSNPDQESIELDQVMVDPSYSETPSAPEQQMVAENVQQVKKAKTPVTLVNPKPTSASKPATAIASSRSSTNKNLGAWNVPMSKKSASVLKITVPPVPDVSEQSLDSSWTTVGSKNKVGKRIATKKEPKLVLNKGEDALEEGDLKFLLKVRSSRK